MKITRTFNTSLRPWLTRKGLSKNCWRWCEIWIFDDFRIVSVLCIFGKMLIPKFGIEKILERETVWILFLFREKSDLRNHEIPTFFMSDFFLIFKRRRLLHQHYTFINKSTKILSKWTHSNILNILKEWYPNLFFDQ